jgi:hypothetical protein
MMLETLAEFTTNLHLLRGSSSTTDHTLGYILLFLSPFAALWLIRVLIIAVLTGHTTEFITAFLLIVSARHSAIYSFSVWSVVATAGAGTAFILLLMVRRS